MQATHDHAQKNPDHPHVERQSVMRLLAEADEKLLEQAYENFGAGDWRFVRRPETGLVMVRGRIGGGGAPFNLGEMSVTRAAIALGPDQGGHVGHAYVAGRSQRKAAIAAFFDAAWQNDDLQGKVEAEVLPALRAQRSDADVKKRRQAEATRVDFFTLVSGDA